MCVCACARVYMRVSRLLKPRKSDAIKSYQNGREILYMLHDMCTYGFRFYIYIYGRDHAVRKKKTCVYLRRAGCTVNECSLTSSSLERIVECRKRDAECVIRLRGNMDRSFEGRFFRSLVLDLNRSAHCFSPLRFTENRVPPIYLSDVDYAVKTTHAHSRVLS